MRGIPDACHLHLSAHGADRKANAVRAGIESTVNEFVNGHGMRQARYRSQTKTHVQHVLTAIAVNIERVNAELTTPTAERRPRTPTALQNFLDWQRIPRPPHGAPQENPDCQDCAVRNARYRLKASWLSGVKHHSSRADRSSGSVSQPCQATSSGSGTTASGTTASCTLSQ